jgi:hypothetical protein
MLDGYPAHLPLHSAVHPKRVQVHPKRVQVGRRAAASEGVSRPKQGGEMNLLHSFYGKLHVWAGHQFAGWKGGLSPGGVFTRGEGPPGFVGG